MNCKWHGEYIRLFLPHRKAWFYRTRERLVMWRRGRICNKRGHVMLTTTGRQKTPWCAYCGRFA